MPSLTSPRELQTSAEDVRIAWLSALAIGIHVLEAAVPSPLPGMKPGMANVITIIALVQFGWATAAWISVLRVIGGSLLIGTFLSPTFLMSFSGALCSMVVLAGAMRLPGRGFGPVGYSVVAAMAHMSGQFLIAYSLFIPHPGLWSLFPVLLTASVVFGLLGGIIAAILLQGVDLRSP